MAETVRIEGGGNEMMIIIIVFIFMICILSSVMVWILNPDIFKKEGDKCKIDNQDIRGTYEIDDKGKCVLKSCSSGWKVDGKKCTKIIESIGGAKVPPPKSSTPTPSSQGATSSGTYNGGATSSGTYNGGDTFSGINQS